MRFFQKIGDIWRHEELRQKLGVTLGLILVYRVGSFIVLPGVNSDVLAEQMSQLGSGGLGDI
ncbi:MAG TPA: preprotein translocase subunit SecY, partial [Flavobacteriales bacterium]|nr:preprotein translocase subunit SecY [Flavobacteriales bacterium]